MNRLLTLSIVGTRRKSVCGGTSPTLHDEPKF